jgi:hypothetical protein
MSPPRITTSVRLRIFVCLLILSCSLVHEVVFAQEVSVEWNVAANPSSGGWHPLYDVHADPENGSNLIICGSKWNFKDNASYGFVYSSSDGGKTWRQALEDKSSAWVSEQSCAYGTHGVAYFVADASKVIDGELHHDLGTTRIYVSQDSGKTWKLGIATGWTDYSASVVDTAPGPNQNRLYIFFNGLDTFYSSLGNKDAVEAESNNTNGTRVGVVSYKDGDTQISGPFTSAEMAQAKYHGSYPAPALRLKDGSLLTFYTTKRRNENNIREFLAYTVRVNPNRDRLEAPAKVASELQAPKQDPKVDCDGVYLDAAAAYDSERDKLYFAYPSVQDKKCRLLIATSADGGKTWSKADAVYSPDATAERVYGSPSIAVNKDGTLGVLWEERYRSGCWMFAASVDGGKSLSRAKQLGTCSGTEAKPSALTNAYLWTSIFETDPADKASEIRINLRNTRNSGGPQGHGIAVTSDGSFHPVWITAGRGEGEIRTAAVRVTPADALIMAATGGLEEVTNKVSILYGGDQHYDASTGFLTLDVVVRNNGAEPLHGPFRLAVTSLYKDYGYMKIANANNRATGAGTVWDLDSSIPSGVLAPGATSRPFSLKFHYLIDEDAPRGTDDILGISTKLFAGAQKAQAVKTGAALAHP